MKGKITVLVGISGSGKSTWAHEEWSKEPLKTVIVNRDKIRESLFGFSEKSIKDYYKREDVFSLEKVITRYEDDLIAEGLNQGKHVIVDATHLKIEYLERYRFWNVPVEVKSFNIPVNKAIENDRKRIRQVGDEVIKKQFNQLTSLINNPKLKNLDLTPVTFKQDKSLPTCIIFDIDGTIAHKGERSPYDWKRVEEDTVDESVVEVMQELVKANESAIIICTGRDGISEFQTKRWLINNGILFDGLFIRDEGDMRPDWVVKEEMWREIAKSYYIVGMFDDRNQVVRRARSLGLKVMQVENGYF